MNTSVAAVNRRSQSYLYWLTGLGTLAVLSSSFDAVARNVALPEIMRSLDITITQAGYVFSGAFFASFLANVFIGPIMDRVGRKRGLVITLVATAIASGSTAFVQNLWQYALVGFFSGICLSVQESAQIIVAEESPASIRGRLIGIVVAGFPLGAIVVGLVAQLLLPGHHWRALFFIAYCPIVVAIIVMFATREPPRSQEALIVKRAIRESGTGSGRSNNSLDRVLQGTKYSIDTVRARRVEWAQVFAPDLRRQTILVSLYGLLVNFSTGLVLALGVTFLVEFDHVSVAAGSGAIVIEGIGAVIGTVALGFLNDYFSPRNILVISAIIGGVAVALLSVRGGTAWVLSVMAIFGFFGQGIIGCYFRYMSDAFPTRVRGSGTSFGVGVFFLGLAFAPALFGNLMGRGEFVATALVAGAATVVGALLLLGARDIRPGQVLEDIAK